MVSALVAILLAAPAASSAPAALAHSVQAYYDRTHDFEARFVQKYTYAAFGRTQTSEGTLRVKKPGKMRWDYTEPSPKTIVLDGSRLTQYEPDANQVYVDDHFDATAMSAAVTFLLGKGSLEKEFDLSTEGPGELVLTPKVPDARVARIVLTVGASGEVTGTRVVDGSGNVNAITFKDLRRNVGLNDSVFVLELPKDVRHVKVPGAQ